MERTLIADLGAHTGETVSLSGFVDVRRDQGKMVFFDFRDRSGMVQGVVLPNSPALETAKEVRNEYVVTVTGIVNQRPEKNVQEGKVNGNIELEVVDIEILARTEELPFALDEHLNLDTYLDHLPYTLRSERSRAIFTVQSRITKAYRDYLNSLGFTEFQAPKLIGDDAEGSGEVFEVPYFYGKTAHLATSPQLYKQIMVGVFERVFAVGTVFRAEKHSTSRHLNEYTSMDAEIGFISDHRDVMKIETELLRYITQELRTHCAGEFALLGAEVPIVPEEIPSMKLREAQALIFAETGRDNREEPDLEPEDERWLCEWSMREKNSDFVFVTHYPVSKRPMYTMEDQNDPGYTNGFDLLFRGV